MILVSAKQMRLADERTINEIGLPGIVLMENAARGAAKVIVEAVGEVEGLAVAAFCGRGNNGGDGLAVLRMLAQKGAVCTAFLLAKAEQLGPEVAINLRVAEACGVEVIELPDEDAFDLYAGEMAAYDIYVDAILGTGLSAPVEGLYLRAIEALNESDAPILAIDIPSGLSADTGRPLGQAVRADWTATFGAVKRGLLLDFENHAGELSLVDISIPPHVFDELDIDCLLLEPQTVAALLPPRDASAHKGDFGHLLVVGGAPGYSGAPCLAAMGGLRAGAGLVTVALPAGLNIVAETKLTACMSHPLPQTATGALDVAALEDARQLMASRQALALGPGLGRAAESAQLAIALMNVIEAPLVIDADALNALAESPEPPVWAAEQVALCPHPGEAGRLLGCGAAEVQADRLGAARRIAAKYNAVCLLKGARSVIAAPDGLAWVNDTGSPLLASGGSGDVLTGLIGGLLAQGASALEAALCGAFIHGLAAQLAAEEFGLRGLAAEELADYLPAAFATLEAGHDHDHHDED